MANGPDIQKIKSEKRNQRVEPGPLGMTRRRFLTYLGAGSAALTAGSAGVLPGSAEAQQQGANKTGAQDGKAASGGGRPSSP